MSPERVLMGIPAAGVALHASEATGEQDVRDVELDVHG